ncbi:MAG TPA: isochorismate synthase [Candidatus Dormibacteraeota bacterium]|jgi:salicylate biosynthesis isochorismate synthase/menaquinone-specific isochorismate synthase|nr:isochorismate synthase [Candidatus Dormibacteraeota bacterium]
MPVQELGGTPDLTQLAGGARDAGLEVNLFERSVPDAVSILAIGRSHDVISIPGGAAVENASGVRIDEERDDHPLLAVHRLWARLAPALGDGSGPPGTGPVALGGFAYDPSREPGPPWCGFPGVLFRVPRLAVARVRGRTFTWGDASLLDLEAGESAPPGRGLEVEPVRTPSAWQEMVASAIGRLRAGAAEKVVLAREVLVRADGPLPAADVAGALRASYPACYTYLVSGGDGSAFVGASPELLLRRSGNRAVSQPMAGSIARGGDEAEDDALAERLRRSAKDAAEHRITAREVAASLERVALSVSAGDPQIVRFTNIQHLATTIDADLGDDPPGLLQIAAALHPTPAINGMPRQAARRLIADLEGMERGWYTGAVGWMDSRCDGELVVAIRCGLLCPEGARLYAGNGVMPDSDPATELAETELKFPVLLGALRR